MPLREPSGSVKPPMMNAALLPHLLFSHAAPRPA